MQAFKYFFLVLCCCLPGPGLRAQQHTAQPPAALRKAFAQLAALDGYACQVTIRRSVPGDTLQFPVDKQQHYRSRADFIAWSQSASLESLICPKGMYRADLQQRKVYYTPFDDSTSGALRSQYTAPGFAPAWDSLLLYHCRTVKHKRQGNTEVFTLDFAADMPLRSMRVTCKPGTALPLQVAYTREEQLGTPGMIQSGKGVLLREEALTEQFSQGMPPALRALLPQITTLAIWLEQHYAGFSLEKI